MLAAQRAALEELDLDAASQAAIFAGNFNRVFGGSASPPGGILAQGRGSRRARRRARASGGIGRRRRLNSQITACSAPAERPLRRR